MSLILKVTSPLTSVFRYIKNSAGSDAAGLLNAKLSTVATARFQGRNRRADVYTPKWSVFRVEDVAGKGCR
jgi:hypothetical protein